MKKKREIELIWDSDSVFTDKNTGEGVYMELNVYNDESEFELEENKEIGFAKTWKEAIIKAKELAKEYNAEFDESIYQ
jgi:hypothetical protein